MQKSRQERVRAELWRRGELLWKLHEAQKDIRSVVRNIRGKRAVINCSRRLGKSYYLCSEAIEACQKKPGAMVRYAAPTGKDLRKIVLPLTRQIIQDCPKDIKPEWKSMDSFFKFPNGSEWHLAGCDNGNAENLRGTSADLGIIDEAAFVDDLDYVVKDILMPQLMYNDAGRIIIASTPPKSPAHDFVRYVMEAQTKDAYVHKTIWDNPRLQLKEILEFAEEAGCEVDWETMTITAESTTWKREYLAQIVTEESAAIVPEATEEAMDRVCTDWERPPEFYPIVVGDLGFKDATAILFGYYDFRAAKVIVEDELILFGASSTEIAKGIRAKELELWGKRPVYQRFADGDLIVLQDISTTHGLPINPVKKDNLEAQVNRVRLDIQHDTLRIAPKCKTVRAHTQYGIWDKTRKKFDRSDEFFHFDALAGLIYFCRHAPRDTNPYPWDYRTDIHSQHIPEAQSWQGATQGWKKLSGG